MSLRIVDGTHNFNHYINFLILILVLSAVDAKHDWRFMQIADSAGKFACGAQFCTHKECSHYIIHILSFVELVST